MRENWEEILRAVVMARTDMGGKVGEIEGLWKRRIFWRVSDGKKASEGTDRANLRVKQILVMEKEGPRC